jgi:hypothetical protein
VVYYHIKAESDRLKTGASIRKTNKNEDLKESNKPRKELI